MENLLNDTNILIGIYTFAGVLFGFGIATWIYEIQLHKTVKSCCKSIDGAVNKTAEFYEGKISELKAQIKELEKQIPKEKAEEKVKEPIIDLVKLDFVAFKAWLKTKYSNKNTVKTMCAYAKKAVSKINTCGSGAILNRHERNAAKKIIEWINESKQEKKQVIPPDMKEIIYEQYHLHDFGKWLLAKGYKQSTVYTYLSEVSLFYYFNRKIEDVSSHNRSSISLYKQFLKEINIDLSDTRETPNNIDLGDKK